MAGGNFRYGAPKKRGVFDRQLGLSGGLDLQEVDFDFLGHELDHPSPTGSGHLPGSKPERRNDVG